jgi:lysophospholipase L1-like esterase
MASALRTVLRNTAAALALVVASGCSSSRGGDAAPGQIPQLSWQMPAGNVSPAPFMARLQQIVTSRTSPVTIIQLGDSHTAGDKFTGELRRLFQERYGSAGRGEMGAGAPFGFYEPTLVAVLQTEGWRVESSRSSEGFGPFSISGYTVVGEDPADSMVLQSTEPEGFDVVEVGAFSHPGGGSVEVLVDGRQMGIMRTDGRAVELLRFRQEVLRGSRQLVLRPVGDGEVWLSSWDTYRNTRGVVLESHGVVGATVNVSNRWDRDAYLAELYAADPALVIVAYGTNEGFNDELDPSEYKLEFTAQIQQIEAAAPNASLVIVGPPDAARLPENCRTDEVESITVPCGPLTQSERINYTQIFGASTPQGSACRWHQPPNLELVRIVQAQVANERGHYFWDWSRAMGGACAIHQWAQREPALARRDHIHLTDEGYRLSAAALFRDLTGGSAVASLPHSAAPQQSSAPLMLDAGAVQTAAQLFDATPP